MGESLPDPAFCCAVYYGACTVLSLPTIPVGGADPKGKDETMDHFVGIDVSLDSCAVCVLTPSGAVAREAKVACEPETLIAFLRDLNLTIACVGLEAGPLS